MHLEEIAIKFDQDGYVLLPQVISKAELVLFQTDTALMIGAEAFVFKTPGNGKEIPVHCDCDASDPTLAP